MIKVNLNDKVRVSLTYYGVRRFRQYHRDLNLDPDIYERHARNNPTKHWDFQLYEVIEIFGPACDNGAEPMFVGNSIEILTYFT